MSAVLLFQRAQDATDVEPTSACSVPSHDTVRRAFDGLRRQCAAYARAADGDVRRARGRAFDALLEFTSLGERLFDAADGNGKSTRRRRRIQTLSCAVRREMRRDRSRTVPAGGGR